MSKQEEIQKLEVEIGELITKLNGLRKENPSQEVANYMFSTTTGEISLHDLFGQHDTLMVIHNMGQGCRYCTLWGDGINGFLPHLENTMAVAMVSKDDPVLQRQFANARGWRFTTASHGGKGYIEEQTVSEGSKNMPGVVVYTRKGNTIYRKNASVFGPGDLYCSLWHLISLAGMGVEEFTPQFHYWKRPEAMEDGGKNVL
ncbi:MAG: DUF899 family protein [Deltaproteobacteria bacterium]|nr:DUF899 family protein [Deltaproteobacteria bacterium]